MNLLAIVTHVRVDHGSPDPQLPGFFKVILCHRIAGNLYPCESAAKFAAKRARRHIQADFAETPHALGPRFFNNTPQGRQRLWTYGQALSDVYDIRGLCS